MDIRKLKRDFFRFMAGKKLDYYNCNYNDVISFGYNCEVSQRLSDIFKDNKFEHYLYTWSYENDRDLFLDSLNNLKNFAQGNYSVLAFKGTGGGGAIAHEPYKISFHSRFKYKDLFNEDGTPTEKTVSAIDELKSRVDYLALKLEQIFHSDKSVLFIIKLKYKDINDDINFIKRLDKTLKNKFTNPKAKYKLLVMLSKKDYPKKFRKELVKQKTETVDFGIISSFSLDAYTDIGGDIFGWYRVLKSHIKSN